MKSPVYDALMRLLIGLRRWYVASVNALLPEEDQEAREAIAAITRVTDALRKREKYGRH